MERWVDENPEIYRKMIESNVKRLEKKIARSPSDEKKLESYKKKLENLK